MNRNGCESMKYMVIVHDKKMVTSVMEECDAFLFGIENYSVNFPYYVSLETLKELVKTIKDHHKQVFVALNKNFHHEELEALKKLLQSLNQLDLDGILYYDIALIQLKKEGLIKAPLGWSQEHLTTNYDTCNFWQKQGASMALLSSEITLQEIIDIRAHTSMSLIVPIFGYLPMFVSKRHLVQNYLEKFQLEGKTKSYFIEKEQNRYPIIDHKQGTEVYSSNLLNGLTESISLKDVGIDYLLFNSFMIPDDDFIKVLKCYHEVTRENARKLEEQMETVLDRPIDKGFLYKETIFRVKKYEK